ncbi:MAG: hypothetical protein LBP24_01335 [Coriobacteriales bacterium]|jgi:hypothetical protein|nr:hypothetical protein [Coriobacteriales bacterium]
MTEQQHNQQDYPPPQNYQILPQYPQPYPQQDQAPYYPPQPQVQPQPQLQVQPQVPPAQPQPEIPLQMQPQIPLQPQMQYQPAPPPPVTEQRIPDFSKIGGFLLTFIILQAIYAFSMLASFPGALEEFLKGIVDRDSVAILVASLIAIVTLIVYSSLIIVTVLQVITRSSSFLRNFQIAGIIACAGNFIVFIIKEFMHIVQMFGDFDTYYYMSSIDYHWGLVMLAILWTIFWSLYFIKSARMMTFMSPDNPYTHDAMTPYVEKALFGKGK